MPEAFELRLEVPFIAPDNAAIVSSRLKDAISEAAVESGVDAIVEEGKLEPVFGQPLPTKEEVAIVLAVLAFTIEQAPKAWPRLKAFLEELWARLRKATPGVTITADITIDKKKVRVENFTSEDGIKVTTDEYEVFLRPRSKS